MVQLYLWLTVSPGAPTKPCTPREVLAPKENVWDGTQWAIGNIASNRYIWKIISDKEKRILNFPSRLWIEILVVEKVSLNDLLYRLDHKDFKSKSGWKINNALFFIGYDFLSVPEKGPVCTCEASSQGFRRACALAKRRQGERQNHLAWLFFIFCHPFPGSPNSFNLPCLLSN